GEDLAAILSRPGDGQVAAEEARRHGLAGARVAHLAVARQVNRLFLVVDLLEERPIAVRDASEERGHAEVIVLGPAFAGMIVTLGALHPHTEEQLRALSRPHLRIAETAIEAGRRVLVVASLSRQDRPGEFILRHVGAHLFTDPLVVLDRPDLADEALI